MVEQRVAWDDLPGPLKLAVEARTGPIMGVRIASAGQNSPLAAIIDARDGKVFVKGLPSSHRRVITQARKVLDGPEPFKRAEDRWKPYLDDPAR